MKKNQVLQLLLLVIASTSACKKFVEIDSPRNSLITSEVFKNDDLVTSALLGIYQQMGTSGPYTGDGFSIASALGCTADEYVGYNQNLLSFYQNQVIPENSTISSIWSTCYKRIYEANTLLEGLAAPNSINPDIKQKVQGEAYFIRAFNYFNLVNIYGDIPLHLSTDYLINSKAERQSVAVIYTQILKDLTTAETLLRKDPPSAERIRPNRYAVQAFLARVYLYLGDWSNAENYANKVIEKSDFYYLPNLSEAFLKNSSESIWQLAPPANSNTPAGNFLILTSAPTSVSLRPEFVSNAFEPSDQRKNQWIRSIVSQGITYYYPFKYQVRSSSTVSEYTMVMRLAEQFLIRAEARNNQNNISGAIDDLDIIRKRAGLQLIKVLNPTITKEEMVVAIQKERRCELFTECGDRWFDLKRTGKLNDVLGPIKSNWTTDYQNFPIPNAERGNNPNITQNKGY